MGDDIREYINELKIEAAMLESQIPATAKFLPGVGDAIGFQNKVLEALAMIAETIES